MDKKKILLIVLRTLLQKRGLKQVVNQSCLLSSTKVVRISPRSEPCLALSKKKVVHVIFSFSHFKTFHFKLTLNEKG